MSAEETQAGDDSVEVGYHGGYNTLDAECVGRFRPSVQRNRWNRLMKKGLRAHATLVVSDQRVQVILKPSPGWTSLCTQAWSEQCPYEYHISLCYDWECTPEEVSEAMKDFDGWDMKLKINRVSYNYVAIFEEGQFPESIKLLHGRGWHNEFSCSM